MQYTATTARICKIYRSYDKISAKRVQREHYNEKSHLKDSLELGERPQEANASWHVYQDSIHPAITSPPRSNSVLDLISQIKKNTAYKIIALYKGLSL